MPAQLLKARRVQNMATRQEHNPLSRMELLLETNRAVLVKVVFNAFMLLENSFAHAASTGVTVDYVILITATANPAFITVKNFLGFVIIIEIAYRAEMMGKRDSTIFTCFPWLKIKLFLLLG